MMTRYLRMMTLNVGSLIDHGRRIDLLNILNKNKIDLSFLQETHLKNNHIMNLNNYNVLRNDSNQGVALAFEKYKL